MIYSVGKQIENFLGPAVNCRGEASPSMIEYAVTELFECKFREIKARGLRAVESYA